MQPSGNRVTGCIMPSGGNNRVIGNQLLVGQIRAINLTIGNIRGEIFCRAGPLLIGQVREIIINILDRIEDRQRIICHSLHLRVITSEEFIGQLEYPPFILRRDP